MKTFHLRDARFLKGVDYRDLPMTIFTGPGPGTSVDLVGQFTGDDMDYGSLFAYLFRRFGYPNSGWDPYKEIARYDLATPLADMVLRIEPHPGRSPRRHFIFLVPFAVMDAVDAYPRRDRIAHAKRRLDWVEATIDIPRWLTTDVATEFNVQSWKDAFPMLELYKLSASQGDRTARRYTDWYRTVCDGYEAIEQRPAVEFRDPDWSKWSVDDPFRQYVEAAQIALSDLGHPVGVRDRAINAYGPLDSGAQRAARPHAVAGYPVGALGNKAPESVCELHDLVLALGAGNVKAGVARVLAAFAEVRSGA